MVKTKIAPNETLSRVVLCCEEPPTECFWTFGFCLIMQLAASGPARCALRRLQVAQNWAACETSGCGRIERITPTLQTPHLVFWCKAVSGAKCCGCVFLTLVLPRGAVQEAWHACWTDYWDEPAVWRWPDLSGGSTTSRNSSYGSYLCFSGHAPRMWNSLPLEIRNTTCTYSIAKSADNVSVYDMLWTFCSLGIVISLIRYTGP